jgi:hypothetical protein
VKTVMTLGTGISKKWWVELDFKAPILPLMFIYIHILCPVKVLGNPFDDNFGPFLLNLF